MANAFANENLGALLINLEKKLAPHFPILPEYLKSEYARLTPLLGNFNIAYGKIDKYIDETHTAVHLVENWDDRTDKSLKEINFMLKAKNPELVDIYFNSLPLSKINSRQKRVKALNHIISLAEMDTRPELRDYCQSLRLLRDEGAMLAGGKTEKKVTAAAGSKELKTASEALITQYQRVKYFMRGFFYGTDVDYSEMFLDLNKPKSGKKPADIDLKPQKPIDKIKTGTVIVPPPVISPTNIEKPKN